MESSKRVLSLKSALLTFMAVLLAFALIVCAKPYKAYAAWDDDIEVEIEDSYVLHYHVEDGGAVITEYYPKWTDLHDIELPIYIGGYPVTKIGDNAFNGENYEADYGYFSLDTIFIPDTVQYIGDKAFANSGLDEITLPNGLKAIGNEAFSNCWDLKTVTLPDSVTSIGENAFFYCSHLQSVRLPASLTEISDYTFDACSSLTSVVFPENLTKIGRSAFSICSSLENAEIPDSVTEIGPAAFSYCESLKSVKLPKNMERLESDMFTNCKSLTSVVLPENLVYIDGSLNFSGCKALSSITLPEGLLSISVSAFIDCPELKSITLPLSVEDINEMALGYYWDQEKSDYAKVAGFTIKGYSNAYLEKEHPYTSSSLVFPETYANENGFTFVKLDPPEETKPQDESKPSEETKPSEDGGSSGTPAKTDTDANPVKVGTKKTVAAGTVKVTSAKKKTVAFTKAKNKKSVKVPATVKIGGETYKVTKINAKAFTGSRIKTVTITKNITTLAKNAFAKSKVTKIIIKTKLLKKSKIVGALKNSKVRTVLISLGKKSLNRKYVKKYKPWFTRINVGKKVKVK